MYWHLFSAQYEIPQYLQARYGGQLQGNPAGVKTAPSYTKTKSSGSYGTKTAGVKTTKYRGGKNFIKITKLYK